MRGTKTEAPEGLTEIDAQRMLLWARSQYKGITSRDVRELTEECFDWHRANGKQRVDWVATVRNWIRKEQRFQRNRARVRTQEQHRFRVSESAPAEVLSMVDRLADRIGGGKG